MCIKTKFIKPNFPANNHEYDNVIGVLVFLKIRLYMTYTKETPISGEQCKTKLK